MAETIDGELEAYEVKRNAKKYNPARLAEKVPICNATISRTRR
ncbi:MAG: hypothetical protein SPE04_10260 [Prevotella sp.]|nr:hypothetical protein [Prevotella sp.]